LTAVAVAPESVPQVLGLIVQLTPCESLVVAETATCAASPTAPMGFADTVTVTAGNGLTLKVTEADFVESGAEVAVTAALQLPVPLVGGV
jgi:hypothetical protein